MHVVIYQYLHEEEKNTITAGYEEYCNDANVTELNFRFNQLRIMIKGSQDFPQVQPKLLRTDHGTEASFKDLRETLWSSHVN